MTVVLFEARSSPEEWLMQGKALFHNAKYAQAIHCFRRADASEEFRIATAYYLREQAQRTLTDKKGRLRKYQDAARAFKTCAIESERQKDVFHRRAAECYVNAEKYDLAGEAFLAAKRYNDAAIYFKEAASFEKALDVVMLHGTEIDDDVAESVKNVARILYMRRSNTQLE